MKVFRAKCMLIAGCFAASALWSQLGYTYQPLTMNPPAVCQLADAPVADGKWVPKLSMADIATAVPSNDASLPIYASGIAQNVIAADAIPADNSDVATDAIIPATDAAVALDEVISQVAEPANEAAESVSDERNLDNPISRSMVVAATQCGQTDFAQVSHQAAPLDASEFDACEAAAHRASGQPIEPINGEFPAGPESNEIGADSAIPSDLPSTDATTDDNTASSSVEPAAQGWIGEQVDEVAPTKSDAIDSAPAAGTENAQTPAETVPTETAPAAADDVTDTYGRTDSAFGASDDNTATSPIANATDAPLYGNVLGAIGNALDKALSDNSDDNSAQ